MDRIESGVRPYVRLRQADAFSSLHSRIQTGDTDSPICIRPSDNHLPHGLRIAGLGNSKICEAAGCEGKGELIANSTSLLLRTAMLPPQEVDSAGVYSHKRVARYVPTSI